MFSLSRHPDPSSSNPHPQGSKEFILQKLHQLQQQGLLCDTTLVARDGLKVCAHAVVLVAASPVFQRRFTRCKRGHYRVRTSLDAYTLKVLVYSLYSNRLLPGCRLNAEMKMTLASFQALPADGCGMQDDDATRLCTDLLWTRLEQFQQQAFLCDATLVDNSGRDIPVHCCILAASSSLVCQQLLQTPNWPGFIEILLDTDTKSLQLLVSSLYDHRLIPSVNDRLYKSLGINIGAEMRSSSIPDFSLLEVPPLALLEGVTFKGQTQLNRENNQKHSCFIYDLGFPTADDLSLSFPKTRPLHTCRKCRETFRLMSDFYKHKRTMHPVPYDRRKKHHCAHCDRVFTSKRDCIVHERQHTGIRPHKCHFCEKRYIQKSHMKRHERSHTGIKPHICVFCLKGFHSSAEMVSHERVHTGERPYSCQQCGMTFSARNALTRHVLTHSDIKNFVCHLCGKVFSTKSCLAMHTRSHTNEKPHCCRICQRAFRSSSHARRHERVHTGETPYPCRLCPKAFTSNSNRHGHELTHSDNKPHKCNYCEKTFRLHRYMLDHERTHTGAKPFKCQFCDKQFAVSSARSRHVKSHTGVKPHQCQKCKKAFSTKSHAKRHETTCKH